MKSQWHQPIKGLRLKISKVLSPQDGERIIRVITTHPLGHLSKTSSQFTHQLLGYFSLVHYQQQHQYSMSPADFLSLKNVLPRYLNFFVPACRAGMRFRNPVSAEMLTFKRTPPEMKQ